MNDKTMSKSERILAQIEELKKAAAEAKKREREQQKRQITKAAVRAGVDRLGLSQEALENEFRAMVERLNPACINEKRGEDRVKPIVEDVTHGEQDDLDSI
ncbi:hypothetical protein BJI67_12900 [Acidihalobacter aeolianus]|uniref:Uncharacterized protein n=1 Tax=Acidihalobacter aeolianus TaxID=2792603 RepID=A0A1D8KA38_9GAMM|nr:hypothetical protein [Acidihalobacter aeolianus]AOV17830.1 hypothetical protein BJI67_12900 [Acidihalobacter aeolianus]